MYFTERFKGKVLNIPEDWSITCYPADVQHVYEEIIWEIKEYEGDDVNEDFVVLHDKTVFQILTLLKAMGTMNGKAESDIITDFI